MRDAWAGSFHELLTLDEPRTDAPMHLPDGPPLFEERERQRRRLIAEQELREGSGELDIAAPSPRPRHCSAAAAAAQREVGECAADGDAVTMKQRNRIKVFASMTHTEPPPEADLAAMTKEEAARWIHERWTAWVQHGLEDLS